MYYEMIAGKLSKDRLCFPTERCSPQIENRYTTYLPQQAKTKKEMVRSLVIELIQTVKVYGTVETVSVQVPCTGVNTLESDVEKINCFGQFRLIGMQILLTQKGYAFGESSK